MELAPGHNYHPLTNFFVRTGYYYCYVLLASQRERQSGGSWVKLALWTNKLLTGPAGCYWGEKRGGLNIYGSYADERQWEKFGKMFLWNQTCLDTTAPYNHLKYWWIPITSFFLFQEKGDHTWNNAFAKLITMQCQCRDGWVTGLFIKNSSFSIPFCLTRRLLSLWTSIWAAVLQYVLNPITAISL